ncbi:AtpZ/AtpI family protein [bacterium]|nr:AtpZ/AtpI family protein [bacterium]
MSRSKGFHEEVGRQVSATNEVGGFFASILSGTLLGLGGDHIFGTDPVLVVLGIIAGSVIGFWRMWTIATRDDEA